MRKVHLMSAKECIKENHTIFFLETNPKFKSFNGRRLCAFESAARHSPDRTVVSNLKFSKLCNFVINVDYLHDRLLSYQRM